MDNIDYTKRIYLVGAGGPVQAAVEPCQMTALPERIEVMAMVAEAVKAGARQGKGVRGDFHAIVQPVRP